MSGRCLRRMILGVGLIPVVMAAPRPALAQQAPMGGARLSADTVRVGEPFTLGVVVAGGDGVELPPLLDVAEAWEQLSVARVESGEDGRLRAYYTLVAWETGRLSLPDLVVASAGRAGREYRVELPGPYVRSVLPVGAEDDLKLRGPRPPLDRGFPWLLALALLLAALAAAWWWRRRRRAADAAGELESPSAPGAGDLARAALVGLRADVELGRVGGAEFYDRLETILRAYLAGAHEWPPTRPVRAASWSTWSAMRELHRHAVLARFGGVGATAGRLLADVDASLDWLVKDAA